ncbi:MAG: aminotransferase class I/II-fold pyridoxal phosphate-dependent enzyme [Clostridia bacterium]|nr:aminotransferase class I/II-fold pyridoxal phosphate-dependent enzyme [Clostridia bacterium]MBQ9714747.1 aminotransferase class I/II-fold pyridoxal phosphate-dependent enzyme [Clostridia bacterium]
MLRKILTRESVLQDCKIFRMLAAQNPLHGSFHTPGHKVSGWDITELSYSDNLSCPQGCIAEAERDITEILGSAKSFILTDGSTCGVLSILHAAKALGVRKIALCEVAHKSVFNGCRLLGITPLIYPQKKQGGIPCGYTFSELQQKFPSIFAEADGVFFTSPDYYGNVADLAAWRAYCDESGKLLLVDGAHGGHLHFDKELYAGAYADFWVDGVHKSLPALTQGAVVSAKTEVFAEKLRLALDVFRTTSPSYPIMASVEYAVKFPRNKSLEEQAAAFEKSCKRVYFGGDWTKLCAVFGEYSFAAARDAESAGIYPEFCDGNVVMFYLSPATTDADFQNLIAFLQEAFARYKITSNEEENGIHYVPAPHLFSESGETEWIELSQATGKICARMCGLFPPCTPLLYVGERIEKEKIELLNKADNRFGLRDGKIEVYKK